MPWMIKSRGRLLHLRDGKEPTSPLYVIDDVCEYPFENLPVGIDPRNDSDVLCREVESIEGTRPAKTYAEHSKAPNTVIPVPPNDSPMIVKSKAKVRAG